MTSVPNIVVILMVDLKQHNDNSGLLEMVLSTDEHFFSKSLVPLMLSDVELHADYKNELSFANFAKLTGTEAI